MYFVRCQQPINQPSVHAEDNFIFCMYTYLQHCMTLTFGTEDHSTQQRRHFKERGGKRRDSRTSPEPQPCRESRENRSVCFCASGFALLPLKWSRGTNLGRRLCCAARGEQGGAGPAQPAACSPALPLVMGSALPRALEVVVPHGISTFPVLQDLVSISAHKRGVNTARN